MSFSTAAHIAMMGVAAVSFLGGAAEVWLRSTGKKIMYQDMIRVADDGFTMSRTGDVTFFRKVLREDRADITVAVERSVPMSGGESSPEVCAVKVSRSFFKSESEVRKWNMRDESAACPETFKPGDRVIMVIIPDTLHFNRTKVTTTVE